MCGRYTLTAPGKQIPTLFDHVNVEESLEPRFNIAPTQAVACARWDGDHFSVRKLRWGLIPSWTETTPASAPLINARCETIDGKPAFRDAFRKRRCLIPADGFFEWKSAGKSKQPFWIHRPDGEPFCFAGLWEHWKNDRDETVESCVILTTEANELLQELHRRMPVILRKEQFSEWLDCGKALADLKPLLKPLAEDFLMLQPVGMQVNKAGWDHRDCVAPIDIRRPKQPSLWEE